MIHIRPDLLFLSYICIHNLETKLSKALESMLSLTPWVLYISRRYHYFLIPYIFRCFLKQTFLHAETLFSTKYVSRKTIFLEHYWALSIHWFEQYFFSANPQDISTLGIKCQWLLQGHSASKWPTILGF